MSEPRLTIQDMRDAGLCVRGIRAGCIERGVDFATFCAEGMPLSEVKTFLPDAFIEQGLEKMQERLGQ